VTRLPRLAPSNWNCTLATLTLSVALAVTVAVPETVAPLAGAVIETAGAVVSGVVEKVESLLTAVLLLASVECTRKW
jgi:hypothetical protein